MQDGPLLSDGRNADLAAVHQQLDPPALDAQRQLVPLAIKQLLHAGAEGAQHLGPPGAGVEEVQGPRVAVETQAHLLAAFGVTDLPQVPGPLGRVRSQLERGDYGVVGGEAVGVDVAVVDTNTMILFSD